MARRLQEPGRISLQGEEGSCRLQESLWSPRGPCRTDGLLLRTRGRFCPGIWFSGGDLHGRALQDVRTGAQAGGRPARRPAGSDAGSPQPGLCRQWRARLRRRRRHERVVGRLSIAVTVRRVLSALAPAGPFWSVTLAPASLPAAGGG